MRTIGPMVPAIGTYHDRSTTILIPTRGNPTGGTPMMPLHFTMAFAGLKRPMNTDGHVEVAVGYEVAAAYNMLFAKALEVDLPYILTFEDDNLPGADALNQLHKTIGDFDAISGLYHTKNEEHVPLVFSADYRPISEMHLRGLGGGVVGVVGIPMGFALWKAELFRRIPPPWFQTIEDGPMRMTHDLAFCKRAREEYNASFAVNIDVKVGHLHVKTGKVY